ncbi:cancer-related nucleoside-triphosphatase homolog isoform X2 [Oratosquilla oratoria]|uniref:cancer-related nucleoside-triphosphatase homolog isoform X2 n=1 Tax=Oratosquilla oratoria TaxID=337810 RepID=UPI003F75A690
MKYHAVFWVFCWVSEGVGKTTMVQKVISVLQKKNIHCEGFYTEEVRKDGKRIGFDVVTVTGERGILSRIKPDNGSHGCRVGQYVVDVPAFESLALPVVRTAKVIDISKGQVLVLDEIGKMEMFSKEFVASVKQLINSPGYTILTTIPVSKGKPIPLVEHIRSHADVMVVQLSRENRNDPAIHEQIISTLMSSLSS